MASKTMINSSDHLSLARGLSSSGQRLQRSLHDVLSNSICHGAPDSIQAHAGALDAAQWVIKTPLETRRGLPEFLEPYLSQALGAAPRTDEHLEALLEALSTLLPHVAWTHRQAQAGQDDRFVQRHRHGMIAGPGGLFECSSMTLGLALMAPDTDYPFHQHPPAEFYLVLSPGDWYREDVGWWSPGAGGVVVNPPSCIHAMRSTHVPLLALWGLIH
ncbi:dimethylsulfoniopropionate lyase [Pseudomonas sp. B21-054]|uniref:dimethylsulfoniopropionate lyase n=1 Tax=Pseudomonas sp. B21-054 TaxID=2895494 RepID=UPI00222F3DB8|nr:dimethylsulfoniopropionate lyase [Pseudomonas sp. B21-054]UZE20102.1 dimethylsulfoniopropionate lyase [Pseudomonas sp. B21-054]